MNMKQPLENFDYSSEPAYTGISKAAAIDLAKRYKGECQPLLTSIKPDKKQLDARSIVFPIEQLKKMIWEIEHSVQQIDPNVELGIRMYYGKYPDITAIKNDPDHPLHNDFHNLPEEYSHHHTLFLVPTFKDDNNIHHDFNPWDVATSGVLEPMDMNSGIADNSPLPMTAQMNHGNICPPPFNVSDKDSGLSF